MAVDGINSDVERDWTACPSVEIRANDLVEVQSMSARSPFTLCVTPDLPAIRPRFIPAGAMTDPSANLNTFTPGARVRVRVTAVNDTGESSPSETSDYKLDWS